MKLEEFRRILLDVNFPNQGMNPPVQKKTSVFVQPKKKVARQEVTVGKSAASGVRRQEAQATSLKGNKNLNPVIAENPTCSDTQQKQEEPLTFFRRFYFQVSRIFAWCWWILLVPIQLTKFVCLKTYT